MSIGRYDIEVTDGLGRALAGAQVYWCTQPAATAVNPPSPLANIFTDITGGTPLTQPVLTDGFGHADAYMDNSVLYTVVVWHPLFGTNPLVFPDQNLGGVGGGGGGGGLTTIPIIPTGAINGVGAVGNRAYTLPTTPTAPTAAMYFINGFLQQYGASAPGTFTISGANLTVTSALPLQVGDEHVIYYA